MNCLKHSVRFAIAFLLLAAPNVLRATSPDLVYYIDSTQNVEQLKFNGSSWSVTNVTYLTSATLPSQYGRLTGHLYGSSDNVWYVGTDSHVHELAYYGSPASWHASDVTVLAGGPNAQLNSPLTSHTASGGYDDIYYFATDDDIHELTFNGSSFKDTDITVASGAPQPASNGPDNMVSIVNTTASEEDTFFIDTNFHVDVIKFLYSTSTWTHKDINAAYGGNLPLDNTNLAAHMYGTWENVYYAGSIGPYLTGDLCQFAWPGSGAYDNYDITILAGSPQPISYADLTAFQNGTQEDVFFASNTTYPDVYMDKESSSTWSDENVTGLSGGSSPDPSRGMTGHIWSSTPEVFSFLTNGHVYENSYYSSSWHALDVSAGVSAPAAEASSPIIAFVGI